MNIIELAKSAGLLEDSNCEIYGSYYHLERFAALVEQRVRSEIALDELTKQAQELGGY